MFLIKLYHDAARLYKTSQGPAVIRFLRLFFVPSMHVMTVYRIHHACATLYPPFSWFLSLLCLPFQIIIKIMYAISIHPKADLGPGVIILHTYGVIVHPGTKAGKNLTIASGVVIGASRLGENQLPVIHDDCFLGTGAKVLGNVTVNEFTVVGANSVVLRDTQSFAIVAGNPAKTIKRIKRPRNAPHKAHKQTKNLRRNKSKNSGKGKNNSSNNSSRSSKNSSRSSKNSSRKNNRTHVRMHKDTRGDAIHC